ncbi:MAG: hypothetical protein ABEH61_02550 [Haloarculaceae archaeon]
MAATEDRSGQFGDESCTTTESFDDHGIDDGSDLIRRAHYRLSGDGIPAFEPTEAFFGRIETAFLWAYLGSTEDRGVPQHVEAALTDARALTHEEFSDRQDADLRTEVLPAFYRRFAGFHCAYRL